MWVAKLTLAGIILAMSDKEHDPLEMVGKLAWTEHKSEIRQHLSRVAFLSSLLGLSYGSDFQSAFFYIFFAFLLKVWVAFESIGTNYSKPFITAQCFTVLTTIANDVTVLYSGTLKKKRNSNTTVENREAIVQKKYPVAIRKIFLRLH